MITAPRAEGYTRFVLHRNLPYLSGSRSAALVLLALLAGAMLGYWLRTPPPPDLPAIAPITFSSRDTEPSMAPDGSRIAFISRRDGRSQVWLLHRATGVESPLAEADAGPRFSPDSHTVLYTRSGDLYAISVDGGAPRKILSDVIAADWSSTNRLVILRKKPKSATWIILTAAPDGSDTRSITEIVSVELSHPRWSPDGARIALRRQVSLPPDPGAILVMNADGTRRSTIPSLPGGYATSGVAWTSNDTLVYAQAQSPAFPARPATSSRLVHLRLSTGGGTALFNLPHLAQTIDVLPGGGYLFDAVSPRQNLLEQWSGGNRWLTRGDSIDREPAYSPDGNRLVFSSDRRGPIGLWEIATADLAQRPLDLQGSSPLFHGASLFRTSSQSGKLEIWSGATQITKEGDNPEYPAITPDGRYIVYQNFTGFHRIKADGSDHKVIHPDLCFYPSVSPDGEYVACAYATFVQFLRVDDGRLLPVTIRDAARPKWMPRGREVAFIGNNGVREDTIFVQPFDPARDTNAQRRAVATFDLKPETFAVSPDGSRLAVSLADPIGVVLSSASTGTR